MANQLKMAIIDSIHTLHQQGWSNRRIADALGVHRDTVARQLQQANQAGAPTGSTPSSDSPPPSAGESVKLGQAPTGSEDGSTLPVDSSAFTPELHRRPQQISLCEPFEAVVLAKWQQGLTAQRIYQDLVSEYGFAGKYPSVRRFVRRISQAESWPFRRMECAAGEEAQVDFGSGAAIVQPDGKKRRTHVFRIVLSCSRKGYSEAVYRQTTDTFLLCLENAFAHFGGVPRTLVLDNLKAAVLQPDWYDPELNPKLRGFAEHYGLAILPTRPRTPRHKGKIESGVGYVKSNALRGRTFPSLEEENRHLLAWETTVADTRIHGTTRQQVGKLFLAAERPALLPLPRERFPCFQEAARTVHRDGHVEVARAYYSVPPEYLGRKVWVRWDGRLVRIFNERWQAIAVHVRHEPGRFSTRTEHLRAEKISGVERGAAWLLQQVRHLGVQCTRWAEQMLAARGVEGVRVLQGLLSLARRHPVAALEHACEVAASYGSYRLRTVRTLLERQSPAQASFAFIDQHPLLRPLEEYSQFIHATFQKGGLS